MEIATIIGGNGGKNWNLFYNGELNCLTNVKLIAVIIPLYFPYKWTLVQYARRGKSSNFTSQFGLIGAIQNHLDFCRYPGTKEVQDISN